MMGLPNPGTWHKLHGSNSPSSLTLLAHKDTPTVPLQILPARSARIPTFPLPPRLPLQPQPQMAVLPGLQQLGFKGAQGDREDIVVF
jgi:hypothetical protein